MCIRTHSKTPIMVGKRIHNITLLGIWKTYLPCRFTQVSSAPLLPSRHTHNLHKLLFHNPCINMSSCPNNRFQQLHHQQPTVINSCQQLWSANFSVVCLRAITPCWFAPPATKIVSFDVLLTTSLFGFIVCGSHTIYIEPIHKFNVNVSANIGPIVF